MGTQASMDCGCGYSKVVVIGAGMRDYNKVCKFPHYCKECGVVSVNLFSSEQACPTCGSHDVIRYGEMSQKKSYCFLGYHLTFLDRYIVSHDDRVTRPSGETFCSWFSYSISGGWHLCPSCDTFSLQIGSGTVVYFD
jgi:Zn finger protein HypA/HybF involved in hydrogenase expression